MIAHERCSAFAIGVLVIVELGGVGVVDVRIGMMCKTFGFVGTKTYVVTRSVFVAVAAEVVRASTPKVSFTRTITTSGNGDGILECCRRLRRARMASTKASRGTRRCTRAIDRAMMRGTNIAKQTNIEAVFGFVVWGYFETAWAGVKPATPLDVSHLVAGVAFVAYVLVTRAPLVGGRERRWRRSALGCESL